MYQRVLRYGTFCFRRDWFKLDLETRWDENGILQIPEEFADFCVMLSSLDIKTAIEIGVFRGRSSYFMCAVLMRRHPDLHYLLVDIVDMLDEFEAFKELLPPLEKAIPSSSDCYKNKSYDFVFIDADHSYDASMLDYENVGRFSNVITAFHDIYAHEYDGENGGTVRTWKEVVQKTEGMEHRVFSKYPDVWMGIGCILPN